MIVTTPAIVLRAISYGEADRVVTLLGRATGRLAALARGARRSQKRFAGGLGLCAVGSATLRDRPGAELVTLESFEAHDSHAAFGADVARIGHAGYAAELVGKLCAPRQAEPAVYDFLEEFLALLDTGGATAARLRVFELGLLGRLGFAPVLNACCSCGRTDLGDEQTRWAPEPGGTVCGRCGARGRPMRAVVRKALARAAALPLAEADRLALPPDVNAGCRDAILEVMRVHIPGPLRSVEFIAKLGGET